MSLIVVIIAQVMCISNNHLRCLKYILFLSIIAQRGGEAVLQAEKDSSVL